MRHNKFWFKVSLVVGIFLFLQTAIVSHPEESPDYDILIKNGLVMDGGLGEPVQADVAVKGDSIVGVGKSLKGSAKQVVDARGLYVVPGFIDLHSHVIYERMNDGMIYPEGRACLNYLLQGVTTTVPGQCGGSAWPVFEKAGDTIKLLTEEGIGLNTVLLAGHGSVRHQVMGNEDRAPTPEELGQMKELVREAMEQGAYGLSTGLVYLPRRFAETEEVIEIVKEVVSKL